MPPRGLTSVLITVGPGESPSQGRLSGRGVPGIKKNRGSGQKRSENGLTGGGEKEDYVLAVPPPPADRGGGHFLPLTAYEGFVKLVQWVEAAHFFFE